MSLIGSNVQINKDFEGAPDWVGLTGYIIRSVGKGNFHARMTTETGKVQDLLVNIKEIDLL